MNKKWLYICFVLIIIFNVFWLLTYNKPDKSAITTFIILKAFVWRVVTAIGKVFIFIGEWKIISILSPQNTTYNFSIGGNYIIDLNVSSNFNASSWWYTLVDLKHNNIINQSVIFASGTNSSNTTFNAVRWSNKLLVYANDSSGNIANSNVTFFVYVPNSAPIMSELPPEIFVCENNFLSYYFNVTDIDGDIITTSIVPSDVFSTFPPTSSGANFTVFEITSGILSKGDAGGANAGSKTYKETISVIDNYNETCCADSKNTNITVIEKNWAPDITDIGVQTVWAKGTNNTFYKQVEVTDIESGNQNSGNLTFNITIWNSTGSIVNLFNISSVGVMNFTANSSYIGVYNIGVCVRDLGLSNPHENISLCGQDGSSLTSCSNFSLTVTAENRVPQIISYYPLNLNLSVFGTDSLYFNITKYDPDGTIPDAYWYVDNISREIDAGSLIDEFNYLFGCEVSGNHKIKVEITDGLLNASVQWNLTVSYVECPRGVLPGISGGGGLIVCIEKWTCKDWQQCKNLEQAYKNKEISYELMRAIKERCSLLNWNDEICGFQNRECNDLNYCNKNLTKPGTIKECYYTTLPNCIDGIKNCHDGACEVLVDCGGPCKPCPTCSDGIKNHGEEEIDCGGPCPPCLIERPLTKRLYIGYFLIILIILLIIVIIIKLIRVIKLKKRYKK